MRTITADAVLAVTVAAVIALLGFSFTIKEDINTLKYTKSNARSVATVTNDLRRDLDKNSLLIEQLTKMK